MDAPHGSHCCLLQCACDLSMMALKLHDESQMLQEAHPLDPRQALFSSVWKMLVDNETIVVDLNDIFEVVWVKTSLICSILIGILFFY